MAKPIIIMEDDAYIKRYRPRRIGRDLRGVEITIPPEVAEREARKRGFVNDQGEPDIEAFLKSCDAEWLYNDFSGAFLRFKESPNETKTTS